jgi:hypothetical protein
MGRRKKLHDLVQCSELGLTGKAMPKVDGRCLGKGPLRQH